MSIRRVWNCVNYLMSRASRQALRSRRAPARIQTRKTDKAAIAMPAFAAVRDRASCHAGGGIVQAGCAAPIRRRIRDDHKPARMCRMMSLRGLQAFPGPVFVVMSML